MKKLLNFNEYTFRASSVGKIMGDSTGKSGEELLQEALDKISELESKNANSKSKEGVTYLKNVDKISDLKESLPLLRSNKDAPKPLPETCISYLLECYVSFKEKTKKDIHSKYFEKGIAQEDVSIELLGELHDRPYVKCRESRKYNDFIEGECDIKFFENEELRLIIDIKNSWDYYTFIQRIVKTIDKDYKYQGYCYMELYDATDFGLIFSLMNMPLNLQEDEIKRMLWQYGSDMEQSSEYQNAIIEFQKRCNFDHLPLRERFFEFWIKRSKEEYLNIVSRIKECRVWLNNFAKSEYIRIWGDLPEGEVLEQVKFVELVEVEKFDNTGNAGKPMKGNDEHITHEQFKNLQIETVISENLKDALNLVVENLQVIIDETSEITENEFEELKNKQLNPNIVQTNLTPKNWYYLAETDTFHLYDSKEYNELSSVPGELLIFICEAVLFEEDEAKQVFYNKEGYINEIKYSINNCKTIEELNSLYLKESIILESYLTTENETEINNEFSNKHKQLEGTNINHNAFETVLKEDETKGTEIYKTAIENPFESDLEKFNTEIDSLQTHALALALHKKYKSDGTYEKYPSTKDDLKNKGDELRLKESAPAPKPKPESKPQAAPKPAPKPIMVQSEIPCPPIIKPERSEEDLKLIELIKQEATLIQTQTELKKYIKPHELFVMRRDNKELLDFLMNLGANLKP